MVVVDDGSTDDTLPKLIREFGLERREIVYRKSLPTLGPIRGMYRSSAVPNLLVVDKEHGGKSDALNTGLNLSRYPLFCTIDADSLFQENALLRVVRPFLEDCLGEEGLRRSVVVVATADETPLMRVRAVSTGIAIANWWCNRRRN